MKKLISVLAIASAGLSAGYANADSNDSNWYLYSAVSDTNTSKILSPFGYSLSRKTANIELGNRYFSTGVMAARYHIYGLGPKNFKMPYVEGKFDTDINSDISFKGHIRYGVPFEHDFHFRRSYDFNTDAFFNIKLNQDYQLEVGAKAQLNFVFKEAFPHFVLSYRSFEDRGLSYQVGYPSNNINYRFNDAYALTLECVGFKHVVKLDDNTQFDTKALGSKTMTLPVSLLVDDTLLLDLKLTFTPVQNWHIEAGFGYTFHHYIKMVDEAGEQLASLKVKNGSIGYLRARYEF